MNLDADRFLEDQSGRYAVEFARAISDLMAHEVAKNRTAARDAEKRLAGIEEMKNSGILNDNFASMNIQEVSDDLNQDEAFVDDNDQNDNLDDFTRSQLTENNDN